VDPVASGLLLGLVNLVVIALGRAIGVPTRDLGGAIVLFGFFPAIMIGALSGGIALLTDRAPSWVRLILMTPIPLAFVYVGARGLRLGSTGYGALIPTVVAVLLLERWSRRREPTVLPLATVR
jgi:hypothetical protein